MLKCLVYGLVDPSNRDLTGISFFGVKQSPCGIQLCLHD